jgi:hypothetical protein
MDNWLGYIFGDFFARASGRPEIVSRQRQMYFCDQAESTKKKISNIAARMRTR